MAEPVEVAEPVIEKTAPIIDPTRPLSQQVDKMLEAVPEKEDKPDDKDDPAKTTDDPDKDSKPESPDKDDKTPDGAEEDSDEETELDKPLEDLPPMAKYVMERLPEIEAIGHVPGKADKVYKVKRLEDLPSDFEFSGGKMAEMRFMAAHNANELNARELLGQYRQEEQKRQYDTLKTQEAKDIQSDLKQMQKEGLLEKFKYSENDSRFNDDPAVKEANEIHKLYEATNNSYINRKMNYRISYRDAADKYYAQQSRAKPADDKKTDVPKRSREDEERETGAHKVTTRTGAPADAPKRMPAGSTTKDILRLLDQGRI